MFAIQAIAGLPIEIWGDGEQTVDMIHAADIAKFRDCGDQNFSTGWKDM